MLKETQQTPYISVFKLPSGEEFICKVIEETTTSFLVHKPLTLGQTSQGIQFIPIMMMVDQEKDIVIPKPVLIGKPAQELRSQYESAISGIALPKTGSIVL